MYALQMALSSFESALNVCSPDSLLKVGTAYPDMAAQEKSIDSLINLAKRDQLDENLNLEATERCCAYFCTIYGIYFGEEDLTNQAQLVVNGTRWDIKIFHVEFFIYKGKKSIQVWPVFLLQVSR